MPVKPKTKNRPLALIGLVFVMLTGSMLSACASGEANTRAGTSASDGRILTAPASGGDSSTDGTGHQDSFVLSPGDKIKITVFGDEALTGEYDIDTRGYINMPLIGSVQAGNTTVSALQTSLEQQLSKGYLVNPLVSIELVTLRPFYISGEVRNPGSYPAVPGLNAFKAIAIAGGLTPRAVKDKYLISRSNGSTNQKIVADDDTPVYPGDAIKIDERFF